MIDNINKTEHRFDSMASIGKFGKIIGVSKVLPSVGREGQPEGSWVGAVM